MGTNTKEIVLAALICTLLCIQCNISCLCKFIRVKQCCLTVMELIFFCWVKCHFRKSTVGEVKSFLMFSVHTKRSKGWWDPQGWGGVSDLALVVAWGLFQHCIFSLAIGSEHSLDFAIRFAAHDIFVNWIVQLKFWKLTTRLHKQSVNAFFFFFLSWQEQHLDPFRHLSVFYPDNIFFSGCQLLNTSGYHHSILGLALTLLFLCNHSVFKVLIVRKLPRALFSHTRMQSAVYFLQAAANGWDRCSFEWHTVRHCTCGEMFTASTYAFWELEGFGYMLIPMLC